MSRFRRRLLLLIAVVGLLAPSAAAQLVMAQISDCHIGQKLAPRAAENLRKIVRMVNARHPDLIIVSGDIGEEVGYWEEARKILGELKAPIHYLPGNHDVHESDVERYRKVFGEDYYKFKVKNLTFYVIDSQLLGNYDPKHFNSEHVVPMTPPTEAESKKMLDWLENEAKAARIPTGKQSRAAASARRRGPVFAIQHIPIVRNGDFPNDPKPYWVINEPYRSRELELLRRLGVKEMFVGHWHQGMIYQANAITFRVAPTTSGRLLFGGQTGFAIHTISPSGRVKTEFIALADAESHK